MAIDDAEKRRNVAALLPMFAPGVTPDATQDAAWRQQAGWGYAGIAAGEPGDAVTPPPFEGLRRNVGRMLR